MKFSVRALFVIVIIVGLACGWISSTLRLKRTLLRQQQLLSFAQSEFERAKEEIKNLERPRPRDASRSFWQAELEGTSLTGMTISSPSNAFQGASFRKCNIENGTLEGGGASFQRAFFDDAKLMHATLKGGSASFQGSTFVNADLTGATLSGGLASFQNASFQDAIMVDSVLVGDFQFANLSGAILRGADISKVDVQTWHLATLIAHQRMMRTQSSQRDLTRSNIIGKK